MKPACSRCAFAELRSSHSLDCRIRAPNSFSYWPIVGPDDWCGEFKAKATFPPVVEWPTPNLDPLGKREG